MADTARERTRRRRTGLALAVLGLLLVGVAVVVVRRDPDGVEGNPAPAPAPHGERPPPELAGTGGRAAPIPGRAARAAPLTFDPESAAGGTGEPVEGAERPLDAGSGPVAITLRYVGDAPRPRIVEVTVWPHGDAADAIRLRLDGADPTGRLPRARSYEIRVNLDEWETDQRFGSLVPDAEGRITLDVALPVRPVLEIVDAVRGAPLEGAYVDAVDWHERDDADAPGWLGAYEDTERRTRTAADAGGRVTLDPTTKESVVWVGAPGHAWARMRVAFTSEPQRVALSPGGAVRVVVERYERLGDVSVFVRRRDRGPSRPLSDEDATEFYGGVDLAPTGGAGTFGLEGLAPGAWLAAVAPRSANGIWRGGALAHREFVVAAGQTTDVTLSPAGAPKPVEVGIVLEFRIGARPDAPTAWGIWGQGRDNRGVQQDLVVPAADGSGVARVPVTGLRLGPYQVLDRSTGWDRLVVVRDADQVIPVVVPAPGGLRVRVLGGADRRVLSDAQVRVSHASPWPPLEAAYPGRDEAETREATGGPSDAPADPAFEVRGWRGGGVNVPWDAELRAHAACVVSGKVSVSAGARGFIERTVDTTIAPGDAVRELEIVLDRGATITARVMQGGKPAPHLIGMIGVSAPTSPSGEGGDSTYHYDVSTATVDGLRPGTYEVTWRRDGGAPVKTTVTVAAGAAVTVDLEVK